MKFKKLNHFVSFFMFSFGLAQLPISESNSFMYNKYNYGFDFFNCYTEIQTTENGKIVVWPDQKPYVEIGNISAKQYLKDSKIYVDLNEQVIRKVPHDKEILSTRIIKEHTKICEYCGGTLIPNGIGKWNKQTKQWQIRQNI